MGIRAFVCCSSNAAVDTVAERTEAKNPGLKALRFHSMRQETRMLKSSAAKVQRASKNNSQAEPLKDANIVDSQDETAEASQTDNQLTHEVGDNKGKGRYHSVRCRHGKLRCRESRHHELKHRELRYHKLR